MNPNKNNHLKELVGVIDWYFICFFGLFTVISLLAWLTSGADKATKSFIEDYALVRAGTYSLVPDESGQYCQDISQYIRHHILFRYEDEGAVKYSAIDRSLVEWTVSDTLEASVHKEDRLFQEIIQIVIPESATPQTCAGVTL